MFFIAMKVSRSVTAPRSWMPWLVWTWCGSSLSLWLTWTTGRNGAPAIPTDIWTFQSWHQEGPCFQYADLFFSFVYVLEVWECGKRWSDFWSVQARCCRDVVVQGSLEALSLVLGGVLVSRRQQAMSALLCTAVYLWNPHLEGPWLKDPSPSL